MNSFAEFATQMFISKVMAYVFPRFAQRTGISPEIRITHDPKENEMNIHIGFVGVSKESPELYEILMEEIMDAEKLLLNEYILNNAVHYENLKQFIFKHKEDTLQIIERQKNNV